MDERAKVIHMMTLSEIAHFHSMCRQDFKEYFTNYLKAQRDFHQKVRAAHAHAFLIRDTANCVRCTRTPLPLTPVLFYTAPH